MKSPAVGTEIEEGCSHPLLPATMEKRKHAEIGDGSPQSRPPLTETWNRGENGEQSSESLPPRGKQGGCKCKGEEQKGCKCKGGGVREDMSFDNLPAYAQKYFTKLKANFGDTYAVGTCCTNDDDDDELIGDTGYMFADLDPNRENYSDCCSNPFIPLDFKQDPKVYSEVRLFGEKAVAYFNARYKETVCFEDIETVTSCRASCKHHKVTINVIDSSEKVSVIVLRGKVRGGFPEAKAHEFVMLGFCMFHFYHAFCMILAPVIYQVKALGAAVHLRFMLLFMEITYRNICYFIWMNKLRLVILWISYRDGGL